MKKYVLALAAALALTAQTTQDTLQYTRDGELMLPANYREWIYLSSGLGMTYGPAAQADQGNPKFDNVFVDPAAYRAFLRSGHWPDRTMMILEIRRAAGKGSINNAGHYQSDVLAVEATVKNEARFPQKWAYFGFGKGDRATPFAASSGCNQCHSANAAVENTFVQFYPTLLGVATREGTLNPAYLKAAHAAGEVAQQHP